MALPVVAVALAAVLAAAVAAAWPDAPSRAPAAVQRTAAPTFDGRVGGVPLQQARCAQWATASATQRGQVVAALAATVGGASTTGGVGTTLPAARATAIFDVRCAQAGASSFLLYEIYTRAAAFSRSGS